MPWKQGYVKLWLDIKSAVVTIECALDSLNYQDSYFTLPSFPSRLYPNKYDWTVRNSLLSNSKHPFHSIRTPGYSIDALIPRRHALMRQTQPRSREQRTRSPSLYRPRPPHEPDCRNGPRGRQKCPDVNLYRRDWPRERSRSGWHAFGYDFRLSQEIIPFRYSTMYSEILQIASQASSEWSEWSECPLLVGGRFWVVRVLGGPELPLRKLVIFSIPFFPFYFRLLRVYGV